MDSWPFLRSAVLIITIGFTVSFSTSFAFTQSPNREKPRLKDFGNSLKRLKWDQAKGAAVEIKPKEDKAKGQDEGDVVRVETSLVVCDVLVLDQRGKPVQGLSGQDFVLSEDGKPQQVGMFSPGDNALIPRSIVLLIDYSSSQFPFINTSIEAAKTRVDKLGPLDRMAIVTDDIELLLDFTTDKDKLKKKLESLRKRVPSHPIRFGLGSYRFGRSALQRTHGHVERGIRCRRSASHHHFPDGWR